MMRLSLSSQLRASSSNTCEEKTEEHGFVKFLRKLNICLNETYKHKYKPVFTL